MPLRPRPRSRSQAAAAAATRTGSAFPPRPRAQAFALPDANLEQLSGQDSEDRILIPSFLVRRRTDGQQKRNKRKSTTPSRRPPTERAMLCIFGPGPRSFLKPTHTQGMMCILRSLPKLKVLLNQVLSGVFILLLINKSSVIIEHC